MQRNVGSTMGRLGGAVQWECGDHRISQLLGLEVTLETWSSRSLWSGNMG